MSGLTVIVSVARPGAISTIFMPSPLEASSSFHMASAQARARSSGESVALTFTLIASVASPFQGFRKSGSRPPYRRGAVFLRIMF